MDPITAMTAAVAATAATVTAVTSAAAAALTLGTDFSGVFDLVKSFSSAVSEGNYWWVISMSVFILLELAKGRIPGTKIIIPQIGTAIDSRLTPQAKRIITVSLSAVIAGVFVVSGRPVDAAVADFAQGWLGAMGLHGAVGMVRDFLPKKQ